MDDRDGSRPNCKGPGKEFATYSKNGQSVDKTKVEASELFDPGFGFEHGGLHAPLDFERHASMVSRSASAGTVTASGTTQAAGLKGRGTAEPVPAPGSPRLLERHARADDRQPGPAGEVGDPLVDRAPGTAGTVGRHAEMAPIDSQASSRGARAHRPGWSSPGPR